MTMGQAAEPAPRACKGCGKLTTSPERRPSFGPATRPKRLCSSCARDFDHRQGRRRRAIRFLILATAAAVVAGFAILRLFRLAFGPTTSESAAIAFLIVAILYLLAIRWRFGLGILP